MNTEQPAANPADAPVDTPAAHNPADDIVDLEAQREAQTPAVGSDDKPVTDDDELAQLALGSPEANPEGELIEIDYEGGKYKVPAPLKDAVLRQADYTRKTMEVADLRKQTEAMLKQAEHARNISVARVEATAQARQLDADIARLKAMPIDGLSQEQINGLRIDLQDMVARRGGIDDDIKQLVAAETQQETEQLGKLRAECLTEAAKKVPNFTDERRTTLESLAAKFGANPQEVAGITEPWAYEVLHYADIGMKYSERQRNAANMKAAQAGNPAQKVAGAASASNDPASMSMEEYVAARNAGKI